MILVTGGTGLVGAHLLYKLVKNNEKVRAIYRNEHKLKHVKQVFSTYSDDDDALFNHIDWIEANILDISQLNDAFTNVTQVYHCAAFISFDPNKHKALRKINIEGTANIVNFCISNNIEKLCYVSSIATTGKPINNEIITEETHWNPEDDNSFYAITKYGAEMEVWRASEEGVNVVIVNPGVILGAGVWSSASTQLFKKAHKGLTYYTTGTIGLIDVKDVVSIMIDLQKSDIINKRFILVAENWSYQKFLQTMTKALNANPPKKLAKPWLLQLAWRLDWLLHKLTGKERQLTKQMATSLTTKTIYSNQEIKNALKVEFTPINKTISSIANRYLEQV